MAEGSPLLHPDRVADPVGQDDERLQDTILLCFGFLVLLLFGLRTISGADFWFHLSAGRAAWHVGPLSRDIFSYALPAGTPWHQTTWLYDLMLFRVWNLTGSAGVTLIHVLAVAFAFLLLLPVARRYGSIRVAAPALLLGAWMMAPLFTLRPQVFCLLPLAIAINILSTRRLTLPRALILTAVFVVWVNMHISFMIGLLLAAVKSIESWTNRNRLAPGDSAPATWTVQFFVLGAAVLANPFGVFMYKEMLSVVLRPEGSLVMEWISPFVKNFESVPTGALTTFALILVAVPFIFRSEKLPLVPTAAAVLGAFMMVRSAQSLDVCAVLTFPFMVMSLASLRTLLIRRLPNNTMTWLARGTTFALALLMAVSGWYIMTNRYYIRTGSASAFGMAVNTDAYPVAAVDMLISNDQLPERILNLAHDAGFLLWRLPQRQVLIDPRSTLYGGAFYDRLSKSLTGQPMLEPDLVEEMDPDLVLLSALWPGTGIATERLLRTEQWSLVYFDGTTVMLARKTSGNRALLENKTMQRKGIELMTASRQRYRQRLEENRSIRPPNPCRLIGAASVYQALGQAESSLLSLELLTKGTPHMVVAWINRGIAEVKLQHYESAVSTLARAAELAPGNPLVSLWRMEALEKTGRTTEARALRESVKSSHPELLRQFTEEQGSDSTTL